jgi:hypothetical protein
MARHANRYVEDTTVWEGHRWLAYLTLLATHKERVAGLGGFSRDAIDVQKADVALVLCTQQDQIGMARTN